MNKTLVAEKIVAIINNPKIKKIVPICLILFLSFVVVTQVLSIIQLRYQNAHLNEMIVGLQNNNKVLEEKAEQMTTDNFVEKVARERLGMVKEGETPIKVNEKKEQTYQVQTLDSQEKIGIYMKDWYVQLEEWIAQMKNK